jgi:hypothetical protein
MVNQRAHGQSRGRCNLHLRAERVSRPGSPSSVLRMVLATTSSSRVPSLSAATQLSRLWARVAASSQAALAANRARGQWASPAPATAPQQPLQRRRGLLAGQGIADGEARVAVLASLPLADDFAGDPEVKVQLGTPGVLDAMLGPDAAARLEVWRLGGMPVLGVDDQGLGCQRPLELAVDQRHDPLALADVEAALGVGEVVLHVHDD